MRYFAFMLIFLCVTNNSVQSFEMSKYASLVVDQNTGKILHEENADKIRHPASITKVMTLYLAFEALSRKQIRMQDKVRVSKYAASMPRTNLDLKEGDKISIREAINAAALKSANDAAVILAEAISGSEKKFVALMNKRAKMLGMDHTNYTNSSGLPDPKNQTTAYDIAKLAIAIQRDYPQYYNIFSRQEFSFNGSTIKTTNNLLTKYKYQGVTGLKTGYTSMSGFNLVTSVKRNGKKIVAVVLGGETSQKRDEKMIALLDKYFDVTRPRVVTAEQKVLRNKKAQLVQKASRNNKTKIVQKAEKR